MFIVELLLSCRQSDKTLLRLRNPRYLGHAPSPGSVYVASFHGNEVEILSVCGSLVTASDKENLEPKITSTPSREGSRWVFEADVLIKD